MNIEKKAKRLDPIIEERKVAFDDENHKLVAIRTKKIQTVAAMKHKQREYMDGVHRLNTERTSANRLMLEALEGGLDTVKRQWMDLYNEVVTCERQEAAQFDVMSKAHRDLEAIKQLQQKYQLEAKKGQDRKEQLLLDDIALRKFNQY